MLEEYLNFYTAFLAALNNKNEDEALEGFLNTAASILKKTEHFIDKSVDVVIEILDTILANIIVISSHLKGYYINKRSEILMRQIIRDFNMILDMCTYDQEKIFQGLSRTDLKNGVPIFNTKSTIELDVLERNVSIGNCVNALKEYRQNLSSLDSKEGNIDYKSSVALQKEMIQLSSKIKSLSKKTKILLSTRLNAKQYGMDKAIEYLLEVNKRDLMRMSALITEAYSLIRVKPMNTKNERLMLETAQ